MSDILVLGGGPAGLAAAITARNQDLTVTVVSAPREENPLWKAPRVDNYPGLPGATGAQLLTVLENQAREMGAEFVTGRAVSAMTMEGQNFLTVGSDVYDGRALILAGGVVRGIKYPGEDSLLGVGVSYCAVCDGMLYRGKRVAVIGRSEDAPREANYLAGLGCEVTYLSPGGRPEGLEERISFRPLKQTEIVGEDRVTALRVGEETIPCDGVFILRAGVAPTDLLPALETENGYIKVDRNMKTNLPGVFAAGDCTGKPLQMAKAVGEGLVAAESAANWLEQIKD